MYRFLLIIGLVLSAQIQAADNTVRGRLDDVSFSDQIVVVDGVTYEVITESTKVLYGGETVGEEGLTAGDLVQLIMGEEDPAKGKTHLIAVIIIQGSKSGLES